MKATQIIQDLVQSSFEIGEPFSTEIELNPPVHKDGFVHHFVFSKDYLIDICAWDRAYCLDILVFLNDEETKDSVWSAAGACYSEESFRLRYAQLLVWLEERKCSH